MHKVTTAIQEKENTTQRNILQTSETRGVAVNYTDATLRNSVLARLRHFI